MFGPRAAGTSATVKASRSAEMAAPALGVPVTAAEQNAQVPAATAEKPEAATAMFQMFGPPTVAHVDRPTSSAPSDANALQPAAPASGNVPTLAPPAAHALLNMFGTFDPRAANAFGVNAERLAVRQVAKSKTKENTKPSGVRYLLRSIERRSQQTK